jgi:hypothetical protein
MASTTCPAFQERIAIDLPNGTVLYGRANGCVFGDPTSAHEHFVVTDTAIWADGSIHRLQSNGMSAKFWSVRSLTDAEMAREQREYDFAMSSIS